VTHPSAPVVFNGVVTDETDLGMPARKTIALVAHDNMKDELLGWALAHRDALSRHVLIGTGTTGGMVAEATGLAVERLRSGPLGGDQQIGARISENACDVLLFFWDPLEPQPHDPDIKALLRIAVVWNIPVACNRASADFIMSSPHMTTDYVRRVPNHRR
jgi:methylglyoxal synthase